MSTSSIASSGLPEQTTPRRAAMTRSFTVPPKLTVSTRAAAPQIGAADGIETLYVHPSASIIKFNTGGSRPSSSSGSPLARHTDASAGTLPWSYPTESTVAVGPMEIYRVPGSVSFLHSGALLHAILPRSQCWCVDGVSKFAFRVLPETYYRIELPGETAEDLELVEALKVTLKKVLFYERTPCPFARGFIVDLPVEEIKIKKRNSVREGPAKKWRMEKTYIWKPEGWEEEELKRQLDAASLRSTGAEKRLDRPDEEDETPSRYEEEGEEEPVETIKITPSKPRPTALGSMRSVTAPSHVRTQQTIPSRVRSRVQAVENVDRAEKAEKVRFVAEVERRSSVRAKRLSTIPVDMPPSPPDSSAGAEVYVDVGTNNLDGDGESTTGEVDGVVSSDGVESIDDTNLDDTIPTSESNDESDTSLVGHQHELDDITHPSEVATPQSLEVEIPAPEPQAEADDAELRHDESEAEVVEYGEESIFRHSAQPSSSESHKQRGVASNEDGSTKVPQIANPPEPARGAAEDPYAAIQARIQARRSIGGTTTSFHPTSNPPTRKSTSSNAAPVSIAPQRPNKPTLAAQRNQSITAALVNKAFAVFLGPPAHLVSMMLRIAARFSSGAFGSNSMFFVESPIGSPRRIPGSFYLEDEEDQGWKSEEEWDEDDFGVPLKSPVRISGLRERARRHGWEVE